MCDHRDLPVLTPSFPTRRSSYLAGQRAHLREHGYVSIAFLWIGTDQCLQSVNDPFGVIEPSEHQCVRVALFIGIGMLCRGERPHERLEHAWVESAIDALVGGMDGMGSTPAGVQRPRAGGKSSRVLAEIGRAQV